MRSFKHYLLVLAISCIPFIAVFMTPLMMHSHDGLMHLARTAAYQRALLSGEILPRWAAGLNYGFGMPLFNFYYHLPYLIGTAFLGLGASLTLSFKLSLLFGYLLSGATMYLFAYEFFRDRTRALVATLLFQFAPFHMVDLVVRGDTGELFAMAFLPLVLYVILRIYRQASVRGGILLAACTALLILSHNAISLMYFGVILLFAAVFAPDRNRFLSAVSGLSGGLALTAFYWLPVLLERKFTYGDFFMHDMYTKQFVPWYRFFLPNLTNASSLQTGGVDISFGLMQTAALIAGVVFLLRSRKKAPETATVWYAVGLTAAALFIMTRVSVFVWAHIPILRVFQFPWRFLTVPVFALSLLGGAALVRKRTPVYLAVAIMACTVLSAAVYVRPPLGFDRIDEAYYRNYPLDTTYFGETNLVWSAGSQKQYAKHQFQIVDGRGSIADVSKTDTRHTATIAADTDVTILDNTQYYPGWRVYDGSRKVPVEFQDQNHRGLITFRLPKGTHRIVVAFGETPLRLAADLISLASVIVLAAVWFAAGKKKPKRL